MDQPTQELQLAAAVCPIAGRVEAAHRAGQGRRDGVPRGVAWRRHEPISTLNYRESAGAAGAPTGARGSICGAFLRS
jgi:hypothetical protein